MGGAVVAMTWPHRVALDARATGLPVESIRIDSLSGAKLAAWYLPGSPGQGAVLLLHGVRATRQAMVERMRFLHEAGYATLAIDFQAHGESDGAAITFGRLESLDARAAVAWLRRKSPRERLGAIGVSLGGAAALIGADPLDVDALVVESVYPDIERAIDDRLTRRLGALGHAIAPLFVAVGRRITGLDPESLRPIDGLDKFSAPIFVMAGTLDRNTLIEETREMFARARQPKQYWEVEGAAHVDLEAFARAAYRSRVLEFFAKTLRAQ